MSTETWRKNWSIVDGERKKRGGQGLVRKVEDSDGVHGALKTSMSTGARARTRFEREIEALRLCDGQGVPELLDASAAEGWYVAAWVAGHDAKSVHRVDEAWPSEA